MANTQDPRIHVIKHYGWAPDLPDVRDHMYAAPMETTKALPAKVDLRPHCPPVYDQGQLGSCTGNAIAGAVQFEREKERGRQRQVGVPRIAGRRLVEVNRVGLPGGLGEESQLAGFGHGAKLGNRLADEFFVDHVELSVG